MGLASQQGVCKEAAFLRASTGMDAKSLKIAAAAEALTYVKAGMLLGIGTGSTADEFVRLLSAKVASGFRVTGVPTSERTAVLCKELGVPLTTLDKAPALDLTIDGADEIDGNLNLIKGGGGALLREKIVASASKSMIVIADHSKVVETLGTFPLPIEINKFGVASTLSAISRAAGDLRLSGALKLRGEGSNLFETDGGHYIVDASFGRIPNADALSAALYHIPGVVEHGIFLNLAKLAIIATRDGIVTLTKP
jgi:ribose 5-phosphate isomerase A